MRIFGTRTLFSVLVLCCMILTHVACNKALDVTSTRQQSEENAWKSIDDSRSRLIGVYALFRAALANDNNYWLWGELRSGDFVSRSKVDLQSVIDGNLNASYSRIQSMKDWRPFYAVINAANLFIERSGEILEQDERYTVINHDIDVAQVKALRAWAYFMMVRIWGDVPLITYSHDGEFPKVPKNTQEKVLNFCEQDLLQAVEVLPFRYGFDNDAILPGSYYSYDAGRYQNTLINRLSAYALLAHISAWRGNYNNADIYAGFILENRKLSYYDYVSTTTLTSPTGIFYARGDYKHILAFNFLYTHGEAGTSGMGHIESWTLATPLITKPNPDIYVPKTTINTLFNQQGDTRFGLDTISGLPTTAYFTNYTSETPVFSKIKVLGDGTTEGTFQVYGSAIVFSRLEEITLLKAEALAVLGKTKEAVALLNRIRINRNVESFDTNGNKDLITEIFKERRKELMGEGWRWYDLIRYNKIKREDAAITALIDNGGIYWPIHEDVIVKNPLVIQNSYWKAK